MKSLTEDDRVACEERRQRTLQAEAHLENLGLARALEALRTETIHSKSGLPGNTELLQVLAGKHHDLIEAITKRHPREMARYTALQTAALALRIYLEGDARFPFQAAREIEPHG